MAAIPDAQAGAAADPAHLESIIHPLGFHRFRARAIVAMSADYLRPWRQPTELRYVGKYASDAYFIFCRCDPDLLDHLRVEATSLLNHREITVSAAGR